MNLLVNYAMQWVKTPYQWGGESFDAMDCSGFVQTVLAFAGVDPPGDQTAQGLYNHFSDATHGIIGAYGPGSLAFFGQDAGKIIHVGFCVDQYRMLEAGGGGSKTKTREDAIAHQAYVRGRLIKSRADFYTVIKPRYFKIGYI